MVLILKWSKYFQTPEYLERTRMFLIMPEYEPLIRKWCGIKDGMRILDVGCGTGYFTRLLAKADQKIRVTGLDIEEEFISYARKEAKEQGVAAEFLAGTALDLPFEDHSFDLVTSHTFFHSVSDPVKALSEMKRVTKNGGTIATVFPMSFLPVGFCKGSYPSECTWQEEFDRLDAKIHKIYLQIDPLTSRISGLPPEKTPQFFAEQGLAQVSAYPIGKFFSTSNAAVSTEEKLRWIDLYEDSEKKRLEAFMELPRFRSCVNDEELIRYQTLLTEKCGYLRNETQENRIWDWTGGANVLLTGINP